MTAAFGLGTAQFGQAYGISNLRGQVDRDEVEAILEAAAAAGCTMLDTAALYGNSEAVLGGCAATRRFRVVTKTAQFRKAAIEPPDVVELRNRFEASLARLRLDRVHGLLIHHADDLLTPGGNRLWAELEGLRARGLVVRIGASVYDCGRLARLLELYPLDIVQVPVNVLDQRLISSGQLRDLRRRGVEVHARSVFLQGLLLMDPEATPPWFEPVRPLLRDFHAAAAERSLTPLEASLAFLRHQPDIDVIVVGVTNLVEFRQCMAAYCRQAEFDAARFASTDERFVNPARWEIQ